MRRVIALALVALASCARGEATAADAVRSALRRTADLPRTFVLTETSGGRTTVVRGAVEDAFRYSASVAADGAPVADEVVHDDALAARTPGGAWIVEATAAPDPLAVARTRSARGRDPVRDALEALDHVAAALNAAASVVAFNPEALDYVASEDTFPKPERGSGIVRYDVRRPPLPSASQVGGNQAVPDAEHFRRMSVYVNDGVVVRVLEEIDVASRLDDLEDVYGTTFPEDRPEDEIVGVAVDAINALRTGQGNEPIHVLSRSLEFSGAGTPVEVALPPDAVAGSVTFLEGALSGGEPSAPVAVPAVPAGVPGLASGVPGLPPGVTGVTGGVAVPAPGATDVGPATSPAAPALLGGGRPAAEDPAEPVGALRVAVWMGAVPLAGAALTGGVLWLRRPRALR